MLIRNVTNTKLSLMPSTAVGKRNTYFNKIYRRCHIYVHLKVNLVAFFKSSIYGRLVFEKNELNKM